MTTPQFTNQLARDAARHAESNAPSRILRVEEAAQYVGLAVSTLNKMRISGLGPRFVRLTRKAVGYDPRDLEAWIAERKRSHTSE